MPIPFRRKFQRVALPILLCACASAAAKPPVEEPDNLLNDSFTLQAGIVLSSNHTDLRYDSTTGAPGTEIGGETDLGLPSKKLTGMAELMFRMHKRHKIRLNDYYLPLDRRATTLLTRTINFGDSTYNVNDVVSSELQVRMLGLSYTYSFIKNDRVELGASLGFNVIGLAAQVAVPARLISENDEISTPVPLAGLEGAVRISGRFYAEARFQDVRVHVNQVQGSLEVYQANLLYRLSPNVTFGLGYNGYSVDATIESTGNAGHLALRSTGPQLFARVGF